MRCIWRSFSILYVFLYKCLCVILGLVFWQVLWYYKNKYEFLYIGRNAGEGVVHDAVVKGNRMC